MIYLTGDGPLQINGELNEIIKLGTYQHWDCCLQKLSTQIIKLSHPSLHPHAISVGQKIYHMYRIPFPCFFVPSQNTEIKNKNDEKLL